jgi:hypothetical protein
LGSPHHNAERGLGVELVDRHQHAFGLFNYFPVSDDHMQFVPNLLLQIGVECFGDIDVEAAGGDYPSLSIGNGGADNNNFAGFSGGGSYASRLLNGADDCLSSAFT